MADNQSDILAQFQEFMEAKAAKEQEETQQEDFEVEIWDKDGRGVRTRRSHAKTFLQQLGLDLDPEPDPKTPEGDPKKAGDQKKTPPKGPTNPTIARKYFTK